MTLKLIPFALHQSYNLYVDSLASSSSDKSTGTILPNSNNLKFNFEAVNLSAVDVRVIKIFEDNVLQFLQYNNLNGTSQLKRVGRRVAKETIQLIEDETTAEAEKKPRTEEAWHKELRSAYLQQYVQYMQSLHFIVVQSRPQSPKQSRR